MPTITHQDIVDRLEALDKEQTEAYRREVERIDRERESLRELCGSLGHIFARPRGFLYVGERPHRCCGCCGVAEHPVDATVAAQG